LLACITLFENEKIIFTRQLNEILDYFKKLEIVETKSISPTYHILDLLNINRKDEVHPSLPIEETFKNASKKEKNFFKASKIF
jgi:aspartyl-tRNA(Asn)/glutamyl-tRNA(Gln) amidotransferase subunit C